MVISPILHSDISPNPPGAFTVAPKLSPKREEQEEPVIDDNINGPVSSPITRPPSANGYGRAGSPTAISSTSNDNGHGQTASTSYLVNRAKETSVTEEFDDGSAFVNGAGAGAMPDVDDCVEVRAAEAEMLLTPKQKSTIAKSELKDGRGLLKIIKSEAKAEKASLEAAIKELSELQKFQKEAQKLESKAHTTHSKSLATFQKKEAAFHAARTAYETSQTETRSLGEALDIARRNAREAGEGVRDKLREVEALRTVKAADERERGVKLAVLSGTVGTSRSRKSFFGGSNK